MKGIQLILLLGVSFIGLYFLTRLRKKIIDISIVLVMVCTAAVFITWPDLTNEIARKVGVGRGADLVFYISILTFWFVVLKLFARIRRLEQLFTETIRKDAIANVKNLSGNE
jgi:hypothetical protein